MTVPQYQALFEPIRINGLTLPNRIVMAPMGRLATRFGVLNPEKIPYYRRRAEGGVGLIITAATAVPHAVAPQNSRNPHIHGVHALAAWKLALQGVHEAGGKMFVQLWHAGMMRNMTSMPNPQLPSIGPSGWWFPNMMARDGFDVAKGKQLTHPMTQVDIDEVIEAYAQGAVTAQQLGFDGVEFHGAHGYLIDQFFWSLTNLRSDRYGGDLVERTRFAVEIIQECRRRVGPDYPMWFRYSQWKQQHYGARLAQTPDELGRFLAPLAEAGIDCFDCSQRRYWQPEFEGSDMNLAGWTKRLTGKPTMTVGSVTLGAEQLPEVVTSIKKDGDYRTRVLPAVDNLDRLMQMFDRGDFDLVGVGRALISNADWAELLRTGRLHEMAPYSSELLETVA